VWKNQESDGLDMWHVWETEEVLTGFWWGDLGKKDNLEGLDTNERIILKCIFRKWNGGSWAAMIWLRIGADGGFYKMPGIA